MRTLILGSILTATLLGAAMPAAADRRASDTPTREEVERRKQEVREMERELREQERAEDEAYERRARHRDRHRGRMWLGVGTGVGYGSVETTCSPGSFGDDCREEGIVNTYVANITLASSEGAAIRLRGMRQTDKGDDARTPYEQAALVGTRFGRSNWYGLVGYGQVRHADDEFVKGPGERAGGLAWEIMFAPSTEGPVGLELGFQGNNGHYVDYVAFNVGMRFGALD